MRNVYLTLVNDLFSNQVQLPYAVGLLWTYAMTDRNLADNYQLSDIFYIRSPAASVFDRLESPDVLGLSCYVWNWEFNKELARLTKAAYPECLIIMGGPHPPNDTTDFFSNEGKHVDIVVHYEGEESFAEILRTRLGDGNYNNILGCSIAQSDGSSVKNQQRPAMRDINSIPSPYITGLFDEMVAGASHGWSAVLETHRGCPYSCTFCELGSSYYSKLYQFDNSRIFAEIDWIAAAQIEFICNSDSNFGIFPRDIEIARYLVSSKARCGYPDKFRSDWAKNAADKVFAVVKVLNDADIDKGMTLAVQSMNDQTLEFIQRKNISYGKYAEHIARYDAAGMNTYTEMIHSLPGETTTSETAGICEWMEIGQHHSLLLHCCTVLPNTPLGDPQYQARFGLQTAKTWQSFYHMDMTSHSGEYENIIIATNTMGHRDWLWQYGFNWMVKTCHWMGAFTQYISRFLRHAYHISYEDFYRSLYGWVRGHPHTVLGKQYAITMERLHHVLAGHTYWGRMLPDCGSINWEYDEAAAYHIILSGSRWWTELGHWIAHQYPQLDAHLRDQLVSYNNLVLKNIHTAYPRTASFDWNFHDVVTDGAALVLGTYDMTVDSSRWDGDLPTFMREIYWYGRKTGRAKVDHLEYNIRAQNTA